MTVDRLIRRSEVELITSLSKSSIYNYINCGSFPPPVSLGRGAVRWRLSDITNWIEQLPDRLQAIAVNKAKSFWRLKNETTRYCRSATARFR
ncbi:helix-turn-helix transcriptional regulator [Sphingomonas sp. A2-49]|uniref:helix-turn-helix transcriptional regulator n=1 Tax=Sphingomonas sp. A2-49 TaxID=1391375 RepID=UPI00397789E9